MKEMTAELKRISETLALRDQQGVETKQHLDRVETILTSIQLALDIIARVVNHLAIASPIGVVSSPPQMRSIRLDFPKFDGSDPLNWLFRAEQFFAYYATPYAQRLTIVAVHFKGSVVSCFHMLVKANQLSSWADLAWVVEEQFGPSQFDCPRAQLFKLTQSGSVAIFYGQFIILANRVDGLSDDALLDCFISGLRDHIQRDVIA